ncbi:MAG: hypothetical protein M0C28_15640 [Candidatus Moduliflexus flocculans]|nr:hypothetical protein [Candidatus Moduliflexus flocculans]
MRRRELYESAAGTSSAANTISDGQRRGRTTSTTRATAPRHQPRAPPPERSNYAVAHIMAQTNLQTGGLPALWQSISCLIRRARLRL